MKLVWPLLLVIFRTLYFLYALWCLLFPLVLLGLLIELFRDAWLTLHFGSMAVASARYALAAFALILLTLVYARRTEGDPNPFQSAFMSWFGTLRWFWNKQPGAMVALGLPSGYLVENPGGYRISGPDTRKIMERLQPGDILLRGYRGYVDGAMIRRSSVCSDKGYQPGWFTHVALYAGRLDANDKLSVPKAFADPKKGYFSEGPQMVIHSMAKGVHTEDVLTFCRCDYLAVLRIKPDLHCMAGAQDPSQKSSFGNKAAQRAEPTASDRLSSTLDTHMRSGEHFDRDLAIRTARLSALEKIGEQYDFDCSDTTHFYRFSCAELVYYCYRGIRTAIDLKPQMHGLYPLGMLSRHWAVMERETVTPDDYYALLKQGTVECIWQDTVTEQRHAKASTP